MAARDQPVGISHQLGDGQTEQDLGVYFASRHAWSSLLALSLPLSEAGSGFMSFRVLGVGRGI